MSSLPPENFINIIINTHNPAKLIATAHTMMDAPAIAWEYFSKELNLKTFKPFINKKTDNNIVTNVTIPNTSATWKTNIISASKAGYMNNGINASQGPNTKTIKSAHGVILNAFFCELI